MERTEGHRLFAEFCAGMTQSDVARAIGATQPVVSNCLAGKSRPKPYLRLAIETWTGGRVPQGSWLTAEERLVAEAVTPHEAA